MKEIKEKLSKTTVVIEPLIKDRFYVSFSPTSKLNGQLVQSIDLPKCELIDNKIKWLPITIEISDVIDQPCISNYIYRWLMKGNDENFEIMQMAPNFDVINKWKIYNSKIISIDFGNCDHNYQNNNKSALQSIIITVQPENCELLNSL